VEGASNSTTVVVTLGRVSQERQVWGHWVRARRDVEQRDRISKQLLYKPPVPCSTRDADKSVQFSLGRVLVETSRSRQQG
jgi:hypothetical protein